MRRPHRPGRLARLRARLWLLLVRRPTPAGKLVAVSIAGAQDKGSALR